MHVPVGGAVWLPVSFDMTFGTITLLARKRWQNIEFLYKKKCKIQLSVPHTYICTIIFYKEGTAAFKLLDCWKKPLLLCATGSAGILKNLLSPGLISPAFGVVDKLAVDCTDVYEAPEFLLDILRKHNSSFWVFYKENENSTISEAAGWAWIYSKHYRRKHKVSYWTMYMFTSTQVCVWNGNNVKLSCKTASISCPSSSSRCSFSNS